MGPDYNGSHSGCKPLWVVDAGRVPYRQAWELQERLVAGRSAGRGAGGGADGGADVLLFVEHPPVITIGRSGLDANVHMSEEALGRLGVDLVRTNRGGDVTYHGPGQVVGYPIVRLGEGRRDIHAYMRDLEEVIIRTIAGYGLPGGREAGMTGVWVGGAKVAAIGVAARRWVTYHGFALNVDPDMSHFELITPCGLVGKPVTSLRRLLGEAPDVEDVVGRLVEAFCEVFGAVPERVGLEALA